MTLGQLILVRLGETVVMTKRGIEQGLIGQTILRDRLVTGVVTGVNELTERIRVRRNGLKADHWYSIVFWNRTKTRVRT